MPSIDETALSSGRHYLVWIEPRRDYREIADFFARTQLKRARIFVPNVAFGPALTKVLEPLGANAPRLLPFNDADPAVDESRFTVAATLAGWFVRVFLRTWRGDVGCDLQNPLTIALMDRLAGAFRPVFGFARLAGANPGLPLISIPAHPTRPDVLAQTMAEALARRLYRLHDQAKLSGNVPSAFPLPQDISFFTRDVIAEAMDGARIAMVTHLSDHNYGTLCTALLGPLSERGRVALFSTARPRDSDPAMETLKKLETAGNITLHVGARGIPPDLDYEAFSALERSLGSLAATPPRLSLPPDIANVIPIATDVILRHFPPAFSAACEMARAFSETGRKLTATLVSPGRPLAAGVLTQTARRLGLPNFELQCTTIGRSRRYRQPDSDRVLCIDPASASVYSNFLGVPDDRLTIVGSPRLDRAVAAAHGQAASTSRLLTGLDHPARTGTPLVVLTTQPLGVERAARIVELALDGVLAAGFSLLIVKPHPRETAGYLDAYRSLAGQRLGVALEIVVNPPTVHVLNAADIVLTHSSTTGLEAFALGRPVIVPNPFDQPPGFDLVELGIAVPARDPAELGGWLRRLAGSSDPLAYATDPRLSILRDGRSTERVVELVAGRA